LRHAEEGEAEDFVVDVITDLYDVEMPNSNTGNRFVCKNNLVQACFSDVIFSDVIDLVGNLQQPP
jgi:hypothetical protein